MVMMPQMTLLAWRPWWTACKYTWAQTNTHLHNPMLLILNVKSVLNINSKQKIILFNILTKKCVYNSINNYKKKEIESAKRFFFFFYPVITFMTLSSFVTGHLNLLWTPLIWRRCKLKIFLWHYNFANHVNTH